MSDGLLKHLMAECESDNISMLLISDDMCSQWRKGLDQALVDVMISTSRHLGKGLSMVFFSQSIVQLPTSIRRNTDMFCVFGATSFQETHLIWSDVSTVSKKDFYVMFRQSTQKQYGFLVCCNNAGRLSFYDSFKTEIKINWSS